MRLGTENKRQIYLLAALCAVIVGVGAWELIGGAAKQTNAAVRPSARGATAAQRSTGSANDQSASSIEPKLRIGELARSEQTEYSATGRNIFSAAVPVQVEAPIAPPRPSEAIASPPAGPPKPPAIDVKYLGYTQSSDKTYHAVLVHGADSLMARSGEIIFHRYRVGPIQPASVQVTDLSFNNTQTIGITEK